MTKFFDGKKMIGIRMTDVRTGCDFEHDFFDIGTLKYDEEKDVYIVDSVDYLVEEVNDYINGVGDFYGCGANGECDVYTE